MPGRDFHIALSRNLISMLCLTLGIAPQIRADQPLRTWRSSSGSYELHAQLVSQSASEVTLRKEDGSEVTVHINKLSSEDRKYLSDNESETGANSKSGDKDIEQSLKRMTQKFYESLRSEDRQEARKLLTQPAQKVFDAKQSSLSQLPKPDEGGKAIRVGKVEFEGSNAEVSVTVKAGGESHRTALHFMRDDQQKWQVFAISAKLGPLENTLNFESPIATKGTDGGRPKSTVQELVGKKIDLEGVTLDGKQVSLKQYQGKYVLIDFWATWCGPCRAEIPNIADNYKKYHAAGFDVLAVSLDQDLDQLGEYLGQENPAWTVVADRHPQNKNSMARAFSISSIPTVLLVDKSGTVIDVNCRGPRLGAKLAEIFGSVD